MLTRRCSIHGVYNIWSEQEDEGCPKCQEAEERAERAAEDAAAREQAREEAEQKREEAREEAEWDREQREDERTEKLLNPGEYKCPYCRYKTLLYYAKRCRGCHGDIPSSYWDEVDEEKQRIIQAKAEQQRQKQREQEEQRRLKEEQQKAHEEWLRSPEGIAVAREAEAKRLAEVLAAEAARREKAYKVAVSAVRNNRFILLYFLYLLPTLTALTSVIICSSIYSVKDQSCLYSSAILPVVNWFLFAILVSPEGNYMWVPWITSALFVFWIGVGCAAGYWIYQSVLRKHV